MTDIVIFVFTIITLMYTVFLIVMLYVIRKMVENLKDRKLIQIVTTVIVIAAYLLINYLAYRNNAHLTK